MADGADVGISTAIYAGVIKDLFLLNLLIAPGDNVTLTKQPTTGHRVSQRSSSNQRRTIVLFDNNLLDKHTLPFHEAIN